MPTTNHFIGLRKAAVAGVALVLCLMVALLASPGPAEAAYPAEYNGKIAYTSGGEIYVINEDGSDQTPLTNDSQAQSQPTWSPDGTKIAYTSGREIYVMDADGSNKTNLTNDPAAESSPTWNSDGTKLAFLRSQPPPPGWERPEDPDELFEIYSLNEIYTMSADGSDQSRITDMHFTSSGYDCCASWRYSKVAWSPDDTKIAFIRAYSYDIYASSSLFTMNPDGSNQTYLPTSSSVFFFDWSPDGSKLVFGGHNARYGYGHYAAIMNKDGSNLKGLPYDTEIPAWSPDGSKLVFSRSNQDAGTYEGIFTMNADGTDPVYLVDYGGDFSWQPATSDDIPPNTVIDPSSGPSGTVTTNAARFDFWSTAGKANSTFECSLDDEADYEACSSPKEYSDLEDGEHTLRVRATDKASNTDQSPAERSFTVDTTKPTIASTNPKTGKKGVKRSTDVKAVFSERMDPTTFDETKFVLYNLSAGSKVDAQVSYDEATKTLTLDPAVKMARNTRYKAVLSATVTDEVGHPLEREHGWTFTTGRK
jgi:TolB protein